MIRYRVPILITFGLLALASTYFATQLRFSFDFEQFFPRGDEDLAFFQEFIEDFEADDNFLLVALVREEGVFDSSFLRKAHAFTLAARELPHVEESQSLTKFSYPLKTPFAITAIPAIHIDSPERYESDKARILRDERFANSLINADATALVVYLKTKEAMNLDESRELMDALTPLLASFDFPETHLLGRPYLQKEMVAMQIREVAVSAGISAILVTIILFFIFRRAWGVVVAMVSIALGLLLFIGLLGATGREMNAIAALYPVLMIIVGTSDVIHIMSKYVDELRKGQAKPAAIRTTIREVGMATLLTSLTTAVGFATLLTSRVIPIRDFGINAAVGVLVAFLTVILFTTSALSFLSADQIVRLGRGQARWDRAMESAYRFTQRRAPLIRFGAVVVILLCAWGISRITTNYSIVNNLPRNRQITVDFKYFERELTGFRPLEFAVFARGDYRATDYEVVSEIARIEDYLQELPAVQGVASITTLYKSLNQMHANNRPDAYRMPANRETFERYRRLAGQIPQQNLNVLVSRDEKKARITSRIRDIGADSIKALGARTDAWINTHIDTSVITVKQTGTGLIVDKNAEYIRRSLLQGLGIAILIVSLLMALLFRNWKMLIIALIPNIFPLLLAGALLGFLGIELEAGVSIVFAVIFGIAVDDTIHFLSKYKLMRMKGYDIEEAIHLTFRETGKAIVLTTIILFFGFLVMLFSIHPPSVVIGLLISLTLASALLSDLLLLPLLLRRFSKPNTQENTGQTLVGQSRS